MQRIWARSFIFASLLLAGVSGAVAEDSLDQDKKIDLSQGAVSVSAPVRPPVNLAAKGNQNVPLGLQHFEVDPVVVGRSRGVRVRPLVSYTLDPEQSKIDQIWVGTAVSYSF